MIEFNEVQIQRILNPTSIDLGEYVINPYMGCEYGCLYCYVRSNKVVSRKSKTWGEYVDIRVNAAEKLLKELDAKKPKCVLIGSTTECFQPIERRYLLSRKILKILNQRGIFYSILTRSPYIIENLDLLREGWCKNIFFTFNSYPDEYKKIFEAKTPPFSERIKTINLLLENNVPTIPYFSPILPFISNTNDVFEKFPLAKRLGFECLNFNLLNIEEIIEAVGKISDAAIKDYQRMHRDKNFYCEVWEKIKQDIEKQASAANKKCDIYIHNYGGYFQNKYEN